MESPHRQFIAYKIKEFDYIQGTIVIPPDVVWYRAYDATKPRLANVPLFFGDMEVAWFNAHQSSRVLGEFKSARQLRLLDMRHVCSLLPHILRHKAQDLPIEKMMLSLGLCTFKRQIELLETLPREDYPWIEENIQRMRNFVALDKKPSWANPVELQGVRIGITNIDYEVVSWLKALFYPRIDGIIAPQLESPFHDQGSREIDRSIMYEELILFTPNESVEWIQDRPLTPTVHYYRETFPFSQTFALPMFQNRLTPHIRYRSPQRGGKSMLSAPTIKDTMGDEIATDPTARKVYEKKMKSWKHGIRKLHRACPWLMEVNVCLPLAFITP